MAKVIMSAHDFESLMEKVKNRLLNPEQYAGPYFNGSEAEFEEWAGDALEDAIVCALNEVGIEIDWTDD
jgi:hypothetical protein